MKRIVIAAFAVVVLSATPALADIELEEGATFDGGVCWEADGTEGISHYDGQCITPADYDEMFSYETLSTIESPRWNDDGKTIAEVYEMTPDDEPASTRQLGEGVTAEPFTFVETVERVHAAHLPIAD